jgi:hypothetical protein
MLGDHTQHNKLLYLLSHTTGHEDLGNEYSKWIPQGNELAWPEDERAWEEQGYNLLAQIGGILGPSTVHTLLVPQEELKGDTDDG